MFGKVSVNQAKQARISSDQFREMINVVDPNNKNKGSVRFTLKDGKVSVEKINNWINLEFLHHTNLSAAHNQALREVFVRSLKSDFGYCEAFIDGLVEELKFDVNSASRLHRTELKRVLETFDRKIDENRGLAVDNMIEEMLSNAGVKKEDFAKYRQAFSNELNLLERRPEYKDVDPAAFRRMLQDFAGTLKSVEGQIRAALALSDALKMKYTDIYVGDGRAEFQNRLEPLREFLKTQLKEGSLGGGDFIDGCLVDFALKVLKPSSVCCADAKNLRAMLISVVDEMNAFVDRATELNRESGGHQEVEATAQKESRHLQRELVGVNVSDESRKNLVDYVGTSSAFVMANEIGKSMVENYRAGLDGGERCFNADLGKVVFRTRQQIEADAEVMANKAKFVWGEDANTGLKSQLEWANEVLDGKFADFDADQAALEEPDEKLPDQVCSYLKETLRNEVLPRILATDMGRIEKGESVDLDVCRKELPGKFDKIIADFKKCYFKLINAFKQNDFGNLKAVVDYKQVRENVEKNKGEMLDESSLNDILDAADQGYGDAVGYGLNRFFDYAHRVGADGVKAEEAIEEASREFSAKLAECVKSIRSLQVDACLRKKTQNVSRSLCEFCMNPKNGDYVFPDNLGKLGNSELATFENQRASWWHESVLKVLKDVKDFGKLKPGEIDKAVEDAKAKIQKEFKGRLESEIAKYLSLKSDIAADWRSRLVGAIGAQEPLKGMPDGERRTAIAALADQIMQDEETAAEIQKTALKAYVDKTGWKEVAELKASKLEGWAEAKVAQWLDAGRKLHAELAAARGDATRNETQDFFRLASMVSEKVDTSNGSFREGGYERTCFARSVVNAEMLRLAASPLLYGEDPLTTFEARIADTKNIEPALKEYLSFRKTCMKVLSDSLSGEPGKEALEKALKDQTAQNPKLVAELVENFKKGLQDVKLADFRFDLTRSCFADEFARLSQKLPLGKQTGKDREDAVAAAVKSAFGNLVRDLKEDFKFAQMKLEEIVREEIDRIEGPRKKCLEKADELFVHTVIGKLDGVTRSEVQGISKDGLNYLRDQIDGKFGECRRNLLDDPRKFKAEFNSATLPQADGMDELIVAPLKEMESLFDPGRKLAPNDYPMFAGDEKRFREFNQNVRKAILDDGELLEDGELRKLRLDCEKHVVDAFLAGEKCKVDDSVRGCVDKLEKRCAFELFKKYNLVDMENAFEAFLAEKRLPDTEVGRGVTTKIRQMYDERKNALLKEAETFTFTNGYTVMTDAFKQEVDRFIQREVLNDALGNFRKKLESKLYRNAIAPQLNDSDEALNNLPLSPEWAVGGRQTFQGEKANSPDGDLSMGAQLDSLQQLVGGKKQPVDDGQLAALRSEAVAEQNAELPNLLKNIVKESAERMRADVEYVLDSYLNTGRFAEILTTDELLELMTPRSAPNGKSQMSKFEIGVVDALRGTISGNNRYAARHFKATKEFVEGMQWQDAQIAQLRRTAGLSWDYLKTVVPAELAVEMDEYIEKLKFNLRVCGETLLEKEKMDLDRDFDKRSEKRYEEMFRQVMGRTTPPDLKSAPDYVPTLRDHLDALNGKIAEAIKMKRTAAWTASLNNWVDQTLNQAVGVENARSLLRAGTLRQIQDMIPDAASQLAVADDLNGMTLEQIGDAITPQFIEKHLGRVKAQLFGNNEGGLRGAVDEVRFALAMKTKLFGKLVIWNNSDANETPQGFYASHPEIVEQRIQPFIRDEIIQNYMESKKTLEEGEESLARLLSKLESLEKEELQRLDDNLEDVKRQFLADGKGVVESIIKFVTRKQYPFKNAACQKVFEDFRLELQTAYLLYAAKDIALTHDRNDPAGNNGKAKFEFNRFYTKPINSLVADGILAQKFVDSISNNTEFDSAKTLKDFLKDTDHGALAWAKTAQFNATASNAKSLDELDFGKS